MESLLSAVQERRNRMLGGRPSTPRGTVLPMSAASAEANHLELADLESLVGHISDVVSELEKRSGFQWQTRGRLPRRRFQPVRNPGSIVPPTGNPAAAGRLAQHRASGARARPGDRLTSAHVQS